MPRLQIPIRSLMQAVINWRMEVLKAAGALKLTKVKSHAVRS